MTLLLQGNCRYALRENLKLLDRSFSTIDRGRAVYSKTSSVHIYVYKQASDEYIPKSSALDDSREISVNIGYARELSVTRTLVKSYNRLVRGEREVSDEKGETGFPSRPSLASTVHPNRLNRRCSHIAVLPLSANRVSVVCMCDPPSYTTTTARTCPVNARLPFWRIY